MDSFRFHVAFDGQYLQQPTTGTGQYSLQLWRAMTQRPDAERLVLIGVDQHLPPRSAIPANQLLKLESVTVPGWIRGRLRKVWWEQRGLLLGANHGNADLLHIPTFAGPRFGRLPFVMTIHDLIPMILPEYGNSAAMRAYRVLVTGAAKRARLIVTDSACSRADIVRLLGISSERIRVIPLAAAPEMRQRTDPEAEAELRARWQLSGPVIANFDGVDVRKNARSLIEGFGRALPQLPEGTKLVVAGIAHADNPRLYPPLGPIVERLGLDGRVVLPGRISDEDKVTLANLADLYVAPSLYEGFGFGPLEAMSCGLPVISSDKSSLPEVVGTGGLLVDPSAERLAAAIVSVMSDDQLRHSLVERGLRQAATFSWERTADQTMQAYQEALSPELSPRQDPKGTHHHEHVLR